MHRAKRKRALFAAGVVGGRITSGGARGERICSCAGCVLVLGPARGDVLLGERHAKVIGMAAVAPQSGVHYGAPRIGPLLETRQLEVGDGLEQEARKPQQRGNDIHKAQWRGADRRAEKGRRNHPHQDGLECEHEIQALQCEVRLVARPDLGLSAACSSQVRPALAMARLQNTSTMATLRSGRVHSQAANISPAVVARADNASCNMPRLSDETAATYQPFRAPGVAEDLRYRRQEHAPALRSFCYASRWGRSGA